MKIKKSRRREYLRLLARVGLDILLIAIVLGVLRVERIVGDERGPNYRDGDVVFSSRFEDETPILLIRVRGFDD